MKGDRVNVLLDVGNGVAELHVVEADAAGRTVGWERDRKTGAIQVEVQGRAGSTVRKLEFRGDAVLMVEEVPFVRPHVPKTARGARNAKSE